MQLGVNKAQIRSLMIAATRKRRRGVESIRSSTVRSLHTRAQCSTSAIIFGSLELVGIGRTAYCSAHFSTFQKRLVKFSRIDCFSNIAGRASEERRTGGARVRGDGVSGVLEICGIDKLDDPECLDFLIGVVNVEFGVCGTACCI